MGVYNDMANDAGYPYGTEENEWMAQSIEAEHMAQSIEAEHMKQKENPDRTVKERDHENNKRRASDKFD